MKHSTKDQIEGRFHEVKGKLKEAAGILIDNQKLESDGACERATGNIQEKLARVEKVLENYTARAVIIMVGFLATAIFATAHPAMASQGKVKSSTNAADHVETRIKQLRTAIKITEVQEPLWNNLIKVMRENAKEMDDLIKEKTATPKVKNAVEELKFHLTITQTQIAQMEEFIPLFEALYISMSDEQKLSADSMFQNGRHLRHKKK